MSMSNNGEKDKMNLNSMDITSSNNEKLLSAFIDKKINFDVQIKSPCKKARQKLSVLARISSYLIFGQKVLLMTSLIKSLLYGYFVLVPCIILGIIFTNML